MARASRKGRPAEPNLLQLDPASLPFALAEQARRRKRRQAPRQARAPAMRLQPLPVSPSQQQGELAQARALRHLEAAGLRCVAQNLRARTGELDLILLDDEVLVFVEVRARASASHGGAAASVGRDKQRRLVRTAQVFLQSVWRGPLPVCRFDVVACDGEALSWVRAAFEDHGLG